MLLQRIYKIRRGTKKKEKKKKSPMISAPRDTSILRYFISSPLPRHIDIDGIKLGSH